MTLLPRFADILDPGALTLGLAAITPSIAATVVTGDSAWARGTVIAMSALIACERSGLAPVGILLQATAVFAGIAVMLAAASQPTLAVASVAAIAGGCFVIVARGDRLRSLATFTFIPILYVAFEAREAGGHRDLAVMLAPVVAVILLAVAPVLIVAAVRHHRARPQRSYLRHMTRAMRWSDHGTRAPVLRGVVAIMLGTTAAAILAQRLHLPHGQWAIWSAASVVSAEAVMRKLHDRVGGALIGVPVGILAGLVVPAAPIVSGAVGAVGLLTLTAIRPYRLAFGIRCACVALALVASHHSGLAAAERAEDIVLGGLVGLLAFGLTALQPMRRLPDRRRRVAPVPMPSVIARPGDLMSGCALRSRPSSSPISE